ncbi:hypothetical protein AB0C96_39025 [Streptomyces sp. NPDC048506]|uniref:hypothetical protein n=1 Tax=Streptomyces sp. NPDC048506 TaxID=3155028 RepID=UPI003434DF78
MASDAGPMPGQRKRRRQQQGEMRRAADRIAPEAGRWEVLFETQDESEWREHIRRLRASEARIDWTAARMDTFCGRLMHPTTYRLSLFVRDPVPDPGQDSSDN